MAQEEASENTSLAVTAPSIEADCAPIQATSSATSAHDLVQESTKHIHLTLNPVTLAWARIQQQSKELEAAMLEEGCDSEEQTDGGEEVQDEWYPLNSKTVREPSRGNWGVITKACSQDGGTQPVTTGATSPRASGTTVPGVGSPSDKEWSTVRAHRRRIWSTRVSHRPATIIGASVLSREQSRKPLTVCQRVRAATVSHRPAAAIVAYRTWVHRCKSALI